MVEGKVGVPAALPGECALPRCIEQLPRQTKTDSSRHDGATEGQPCSCRCPMLLQCVIACLWTCEARDACNCLNEHICNDHSPMISANQLAVSPHDRDMMPTNLGCQVAAYIASMHHMHAPTHDDHAGPAIEPNQDVAPWACTAECLSGHKAAVALRSAHEHTAAAAQAPLRQLQT